MSSIPKDRRNSIDFSESIDHTGLKVGSEGSDCDLICICKDFFLLIRVADGVYPGLIHLAQEHVSHLDETACFFS